MGLRSHFHYCPFGDLQLFLIVLVIIVNYFYFISFMITVLPRKVSKKNQRKVYICLDQESLAAFNIPQTISS